MLSEQSRITRGNVDRVRPLFLRKRKAVDGFAFEGFVGVEVLAGGVEVGALFERSRAGSKGSSVPVRPKYSNEKKRQDIMDSPQIRALREYAARRGWTIVLQVKEVGFG